MEKIKTSQQGRVIKIEHDGMKHYAVIAGKTKNKTFVVRFPKYMSGSVAVVDMEVEVADIKPVSFTQDSPTSCLLRQLTGVKQVQKTLPLKGSHPVAPAGKLGKPEPAVPEKEGPTILTPVTNIDDFMIDGVKIKDMSEGPNKEIAKGIAKNMGDLGFGGSIKFI